MRALGVMSGTSCDGADAVLLEIDDITTPGGCRIVGHHWVAFGSSLQAELRQPEKLSVRRVAELNAYLPRIYAQAIEGLTDWQSASCCGMHGQTLWHQPSDKDYPTTLQIGSSAYLAQTLNMPVVGDMRSADVAFGGQGAPIVPYAHWFFLGPKPEPTLVVNLGGMCNMTYVCPNLYDVVAFDTGPGMVLSDTWAQMSTQGRLAYDKDGTLSNGGTLIEPLLDAIVNHPFVKRRPPKSTGREDFGQDYAVTLFKSLVRRAAPKDVSYTLLVATLEALRQNITIDSRIKSPITRMILTGGGAHNPTLQAEAESMFPKAEISVHKDGLMAPQHHEPAAMALIAARTVAGLPSGVPSVTGARRAAILGHVHASSR
jgi:anhydro-N-acetylmuramic acid kinase